MSPLFAYISFCTVCLFRPSASPKRKVSLYNIKGDTLHSERSPFAPQCVTLSDTNSSFFQAFNYQGIARPLTITFSFRSRTIFVFLRKTFLEQQKQTCKRNQDYPARIRTIMCTLSRQCKKRIT